MTEQIHLTVACVVHRDDRFLMVRELDQGMPVINQPAGHVEAGESLQEAALRECLEETGWRIRLTGFLGIRMYTSAANGITYYRVSFSAEAMERLLPAPADHDILATDWLTLDELRANRQHLRSPLVLSVIEDYVSGSIYPLELVQWVY